MSYNISDRSDSNYPTMSQTDWDNAPFNEKDQEEIEVLCIVSHRKVLKIRPSDVPFDATTLISDIKEQYLMPTIEKGWELENMEVIYE